MNNKEGKTFADLFSSSKLESRTLSDDLKNENAENIKSNESKAKEQKKEVNIFEKPVLKVNNDIEQTLKEQEINESENITKTSNNVDSNSSFPKIDSPFLNEEPLTSKEKENINPFFENEEKTTKENDNIFFTNQEDSKKIDLKEEINESKLSENEINNPFLNEETLTSEEKVNPFFETEEKIPEENKNIFFENSEENSMPIIDINLNDNLIENKNEDITNDLNEETSPQKELTVKEEVSKQESINNSSPFFEEEKNEDSSNPFFQGQLNLVENKEHDKPISNIDISKSKHYDVKIVKKKEPLIKFIIGVFSYAIFIFLLLIGITLLVYVLDTKIRAAKGDYSAPTFNAYVVLTGSMLPEIEVNDVVITKKVDAKDLKERDIITFASADSRFQGTIITHRIIKKNPPDGKNGYTFQTRGDNNNVADSALVPEANIFGKVILKIPKLGYLQEFLASDGGWIIVILIPCLVVISYDIVKLAKGLKRKKYKNIKVQK